jgi:hypothetical protein
VRSYARAATEVAATRAGSLLVDVMADIALFQAEQAKFFVNLLVRRPIYTP